ncbi:LemA family protein [Candidatus Dojkabacteria bacterium]|nr:LemA family protein [Candidatus Dojkabacteria bacterium]
MIWVLLCIPLVVIAAVAVYAVSLYNSLTKLKILVDEAWSGIDVQLKRRYDLIPNLVETVKGYAKHEKGLFEKVAQLRTSAMQAEGPDSKGKAETELAATLKTVFAVAENYPELKADSSFNKLQDELSAIEDEVQGARRYYNGAVRDFNTKIMVFPASLVASIMNFKTREFFEAASGERENVKVDFSEKSE